MELKVWDVALIALVWVVWKERNRRAFEGIENDSVNLKEQSFIFSFLFVHP